MKTSICPTWSAKMLCLMLAVACSGTVFAQKKVEFETLSHHEKNDTVEIAISLTVPKAENEIWKQIRTDLLTYSGVNEAVKSPLAGKTNGYRNEARLAYYYDSSSEWHPHSEFRDSLYPILIDEQILVCQHFGYGYYCGAAHGMWGYSYLVYDMSTGKRLTESDVFTDTLAITKLLKTKGMEESEICEDVEKSSVATNGNFGVSADYLLYQYTPYEIGPYSCGAPIISLHKNHIKQYVKPGSILYRFWYGKTTKKQQSKK